MQNLFPQHTVRITKYPQVLQAEHGDHHFWQYFSVILFLSGKHISPKEKD
jgi:hypothetical protein